MMLSYETMVAYTVKEWNESAEFRQFLWQLLPHLRRAIPTLPDPPDCLRVLVAPETPLAKLVLETFFDRAPQPQWQQLRQRSRAAGLI